MKTLSLKKYEDRRLREGHLWIYSNEVDIAKTPLKNVRPQVSKFLLKTLQAKNWALPPLAQTP
jgi:hypothetical protein